MSKSNVKILQRKQNIWKGNYEYSTEHGIFENMIVTLFFDCC